MRLADKIFWLIDKVQDLSNRTGHVWIALALGIVIFFVFLFTYLLGVVP